MISIILSPTSKADIENAIKEVLEIVDQCGEPVEISDILGDPVAMVTTDYKVVRY